MIRAKISSLLIVVFVFAAGMSFIGTGCGTDTELAPVYVIVAPPTELEFKVDALPGGNSYAEISWTASEDEEIAGFHGYRVITYELDSAENIVSEFKNDLLSKGTTLYTVNAIARGQRYQTFVSSEADDGTRSDSLGTRVYGGIYVNSGKIDEYQQSGTAKSGYGWIPEYGIGEQFSYTASKVDSIDLHMKNPGIGLIFYSPEAAPPGTRVSKLSLIGTGQEAFDKTSLGEPSLNQIDVAVDNVYLLRTQEGYYVKIWVKDISTTTSGQNVYQTASFDFKIQPIEGLRLLKK